jgi:hypothetical protein
MDRYVKLFVSRIYPISTLCFKTKYTFNIHWPINLFFSSITCLSTNSFDLRSNTKKKRRKINSLLIYKIIIQGSK